MNSLTLTRCLSLLLLTAVIAGCASSGVGAPSDTNTRARTTVCKSGDTQVASSTQCLTDDAACYQLSNGGWCTGERGNSCPTGSMPLPSDSLCPAGARCFALSESLDCYIGG